MLLTLTLFVKSQYTNTSNPIQAQSVIRRKFKGPQDNNINNASQTNKTNSTIILN